MPWVDRVIVTGSDAFRLCKTCDKPLLLSSFNPDPKSFYGLRPYCQDCETIWRKEHYLQNWSQIREQQRQRNLENPEPSRIRARLWWYNPVNRARHKAWWKEYYERTRAERITNTNRWRPGESRKVSHQRYDLSTESSCKTT